MRQSGIYIHNIMFSAIEDMDNCDAGELLKAAIHYKQTGEKMPVDVRLRYVAAIMFSSIDDDNASYEKVKESNRESKRRKKSIAEKEESVESEVKVDVAAEVTDKDTDVAASDLSLFPAEQTDKAEVKADTKEADKTEVRRCFIPPTSQMVGEYCKKMNYDIDAETFCAFYQSKGWMIGKNKMKDWKAACRTWVISNRRQNGHGIGSGFRKPHSKLEEQLIALEGAKTILGIK